jgi:transcriptional regulator with XRE-family HTH domain
MDYYALADEKIATELGLRLKRLRERRGYSKQALAEAIGQPAKIITALEKGRGTMAIFIAVLRQLRAFDQFDRFLMETRVKALELADPRLPSEGTVMYRRRKADFSPRVEADAGMDQARRKSDSKAGTGARAIHRLECVKG